ncbi:hypothetical protein QQS21_000636 [Conoideocrella luteorostrata]|uniref:Uncharacterized protein n=1 Tax=Conoideocrella luteorostrata TaxID=1105319 RepID=A0AAJ0D106_9HYPO|nr:hypothetical protein QQS21_000636 [Conoideocrella luteorostrata]
MPDYTAIANQAEADLNIYQAKTGNARNQGFDDAGSNSFVEKKFDSVNVTQAAVFYRDDHTGSRPWI